MNEQILAHTIVDYCLAVKKNRLLIHATTWINLLKSTLLNEWSRHKRLHTVWFHLCDILEKAKLMTKQISGSQELEVGWRNWLKAAQKIWGRWWKCSVSWLLWSQLRDCRHVKIHRPVCTLTSGEFYICKLYPNKAFKWGEKKNRQWMVVPIFKSLLLWQGWEGKPKKSLKI